MARQISVLIDTSGSMAEDCKGAVVKYVLNTIISVSEETQSDLKVCLVGDEMLVVEDTSNSKIAYRGELKTNGIRAALENGSEGYLLISDGCFNSEVESLLTKNKDQIISVAIGADAMINNLQRCSRNKKVFQASDVIAAMKEI